MDVTKDKLEYITVENSMGKVQPSQGKLEPISTRLMSEPKIIANLCLACFGSEDQIPWRAYEADYSNMRTDIARVVRGFESYNDRTKEGSEFYLPNNALKGDFSKLPEGRAQFTITELPEHALLPDEFLMMTIPSHDQFNTTIYGLDDRYRGIYGERRVVMMNTDDMNKLNLLSGDTVILRSTYDDTVREVSNFQVVVYDIPQGNLASYFPETNQLIPIDQYARESQTPISKSVKVSVNKM